MTGAGEHGRPPLRGCPDRGKDGVDDGHQGQTGWQKTLREAQCGLSVAGRDRRERRCREAGESVAQPSRRREGGGWGAVLSITDCPAASGLHTPGATAPSG